MGRVSTRLPDFPWDKLTQYAEQARAHPGGIVDLSIGTPVDPTPEVARAALAAAADAPGYPVTIGTAEVRQAVLDWLAGTHGVTGLGLDQVLPLIGSKEFIASLPTYLGLGPGDLIGYPALAYPTYEVGAALVGAKAVATDSLTTFGPETPRLLWVNSPSNPSGRVLPPEHLRKVVDWCRERGVLLVSDECYLDCVWEGEAYSVLHPDICGGSAEGILVVHSLSKRSNLAGYRCAFVAGDREVVAELLAVRKNLGLMMPAPSSTPWPRCSATRPTSRSSTSATAPVVRRSARRWRPRATRSSTPRRRCTCGPPAGPTAPTAGSSSPTSPRRASSSPQERSTAPRAPTTSGSRSPRPTSASPRRSSAWLARPESQPRLTHTAKPRMSQLPPSVPSSSWARMNQPCCSGPAAPEGGELSVM